MATDGIVVLSVYSRYSAAATSSIQTKYIDKILTFFSQLMYYDWLIRKRSCVNKFSDQNMYVCVS